MIYKKISILPFIYYQSGNLLTLNICFFLRNIQNKICSFTIMAGLSKRMRGYKRMGPTMLPWLFGVEKEVSFNMNFVLE